MDILLKQATIISKGSEFHLKKKDILVKNGVISKISDKIESNSAKCIESKNLHVSLGWIDLLANFQDPGFEHKEDIKSGIKAAAAGGFTKVCLSPNTFPVVDSKSQIEYILNKSSNSIVDLYPYGSLSKGNEGKELAELADMKSAGAIAFTDDKISVTNPNLLNRALLYTQSFDGTILNRPQTVEISSEGVMNEGIVSTQLGLKGIPELSSDLMLSRDLFLAEYTNGKLHALNISTSKSVDLIAEAKNKGLKVSCDVCSYNLMLNENNLLEFDSRFKVIPPLRSEQTVELLIEAVKDGIIDAISSNHCPEDIEEKKKELDHAAFGIINIQTSFCAANTALNKKVSIEKIINLFTNGPAKILGLELSKIEEGEKANLTVFDPREKILFTKEDVISKSKNSPYFKKELIGKVIGVINNKKSYFN